MKDYPEREIDRPFTLPKGIANWQTYFVFTVQKENYFDPILGTKVPLNNNSSALNPVQWNQALSDDWQLTWTPLPLLISHQFLKNKQGYWGASFGLGAAYTSNVGLGILPIVTIKKRQMISPDFALDFSFLSHFRFDFYSPNSDSNVNQLGLSVSPVFQITNEFAVSPFFTVAYENQGTIDIDPFAYDFLDPSTKLQLCFPLGVQTKYLLMRQWELSFQYDILG